MKRKSRRLTNIQREASAVLAFVLAEAYARGQDIHYRLRVPYGPTQNNDGQKLSTEMIVDFSVYFDGELSDARNEAEPEKRFKITSPDKGKH